MVVAASLSHLPGHGRSAAGPGKNAPLEIDEVQNGVVSSIDTIGARQTFALGGVTFLTLHYRIDRR